MNATAAIETDPAGIRASLIRNLTDPVLWRSSLERLKEMQPHTLLEVGPGRVLAGLARANGWGDAVRICSVNNLRGVELAVQPSSGNSG